MFSQEKTKVINFCHKRKLHRDPKLYLNKHPISVVKEIKFIGIVFDSKVIFKAHILYLRKKCLKSLNLLEIIAHKDQTRADQKTLLTLYRTLICFQTRLRFLYSSAAPRILRWATEQDSRAERAEKKFCVKKCTPLFQMWGTRKQYQ